MAQLCTLCWTLNCNGRFRLIMYHRQDFRQTLLHMLYARTRGTLLFCTSCPNLLLLHAEASHVRSYQLGGSMQQNRRRGGSPVPPWSSFRKERRPSTFLIYMNLGGRMGSDMWLGTQDFACGCHAVCRKLTSILNIILTSRLKHCHHHKTHLVEKWDSIPNTSQVANVARRSWLEKM